MQETIHLLNGETARAEVNGKSLDGLEGFVFLAVNCGSLLATLLEGRVIEVIKRPDGEWQETTPQHGRGADRWPQNRHRAFSQALCGGFRFKT